MGLQLPGNYSVNLASGRDSVISAGFQLFEWRGNGRITTASSVTSLTIQDAFDANCTIPASATDPAWIVHASFSIPRALTGTANGDKLKLGVGVADTAGYVVSSTAVASSALAAQSAVAAIVPGSPVQLTANTTLNLYLHNGLDAAAGGAIVLPAVGGQPNFARIPVRVMYLKRLPAIDVGEINLSLAQQKLDAGIS